MKLISFLFFSIFFMIFSIYGAVVNISSCGTYTAAYPGTIYELNASLNSVSGHCLLLGNNPIYIDCKGHSIIGNSTGSGIYILFDGDGSIVKNCIIGNFSEGIYSGYNRDIKLENINIFNTNSGIYLYEVQNITVNNSLVYSSYSGLVMYANSDNNFILNSYFIDNLNYSLDLSNSGGQTPSDNFFQGNYFLNSSGFNYDYNFSQNNFTGNYYKDEGSGNYCFPPGLNYVCDTSPIYLLNGISMSRVVTSILPFSNFISFFLLFFILLFYF